MKALVITKYGTPDVIELSDVVKPKPKDNEVVVKVYAASVNFNTMMFVKGEPLIARAFTGLLKPKVKTPGNDIAGIVKSVGKDVKQFQIGDEVFGDTAECGFGAFAEYVSVPENALMLKPKNISFEEAAAAPEASLVALQALRDEGEIKSGDKVLINSASGGIGTFAVQLAKYFGAEVTGVCGSKNLDMVSSIGADHIIDYTKEDFTRNGEKYDLIIATAGYHSILEYRNALSPKGRYVATGGSMKQIFQAMLLGSWLSKEGGKKLTNLILKVNKDLDLMKELLEAGHIKSVIDRSYPLSEAADALRYYGEGHAKGKVVITLEDI